MFESIQQGLKDAFRNLRGEAKFSETNMREGLKGVRRALLDADVAVKVADEFISRVEKNAIGKEVHKSLKPDQQIVRIVYDELVGLMGPVDSTIKLVPNRPTVLMMCGLQGSGKTTSCGKLALMLKNSGHRPLLVAADLQRPAAVEQLKVLGEQLGVPVYAETNSTPVSVCRSGVTAAKAKNCNVVILDTAGRLAIDKESMAELETIDRQVSPDYCYLVADSMTGQDAVLSAKSFNESLELDAVILTKLDGDARGGAALSIKEVTGVPIKFVGMGEKLEALEPFRPEGMASRILGMGDVLSLVEKAQTAFDEEQVKKQQEKMQKGKFDLEDFRDQIGAMKKMGSMRSLMQMMPNDMSSMIPDDADPEETLRYLNAMINSMTKEERRKPESIDISRRRRIASGSGVEHHEVNQLIKQFMTMRDVMQKLANMSMMDRMRQMMSMGRGGLSSLGSMIEDGKAPKTRSVRNQLTNDQRAKLRKLERDRKKQNRKRKK